MGKCRKKQIGESFSVTMDDILNTSIEALIDQGKRFSLSKDNEEDDYTCKNFRE